MEFVCVKNNIAQRALETLDIPGLKEISVDLKEQLIFIFTNMSPFKTKRTVRQK